MITLRLLVDLLCIVPRIAWAWLKTKMPHAAAPGDAMNPLRRLALWWFKNEGIPMPGSWVPHVLGFALGSKGRRVK